MLELEHCIDRLLGIEGECLNGFGGNTFSAGSPLPFKLKSNDGNKIYYNDKNNLQIEITEKRFINDTICRQSIKVKNCGNDEIVFNKVNSLFVSGIGADHGKWYEDGRFLVHYTNCCWQGEFQWKTATLKDFSIFPFSTHQNPAEKAFCSFGSWNTLKHYPMILLEDTHQNKTYIFEIESPDSWSIAISNLKSEGEDGSISVCLSAANMIIDGWQFNLGTGEEYTSAPAVYGCVSGGVNEAVAALTDYKRQTSKADWKNGTIPVIYNCYMNGIWSDPDENNLPPLIKATAEIGAEIFCIDAGWHSPKESKSTIGIGDWQIADSRFPTIGLNGIIDIIKQNGMLPGVWLEIEACLENENVAALSEDCLLKRNGLAIGGDRNFFNFSSPAVIGHLEDVFARLYGMGIRYIKNDFNQTVGVGFDTRGICRSEAVRRNSAAFLNFIDNIRHKYPDLIIENCGSGGLRSGHGVLKDFHIQSVSDQEIYDYFPSIAFGSTLCMPPEKAGIWAMPYPVRYADRYKEITKEHFKGYSADQTVFNLCTGFLGAMYLSGRIDMADEQNKEIMIDYISAYKKLRNIIAVSHPVILEDWLVIGEERIFASVLKSEEHGKAILVVWNLTDGAAEKDIDLSKLGKINSVVTPCPNKNVTFKMQSDRINIKFSKGKTANVFIISPDK